MKSKHEELLEAYGINPSCWQGLKDIAILGVLPMLYGVHLTVRDDQWLVKANSPRELRRLERRGLRTGTTTLDANQRTAFWRASHALLGAITRATQYWRRLAGETTVKEGEAWTFLTKFSEYSDVLRELKISPTKDHLGHLNNARLIHAPKPGPTFAEKKTRAQDLLNKLGIKATLSPPVPGMSPTAPGYIRLNEKDNPQDQVLEYILAYQPEIVRLAVKRLLDA